MIALVELELEQADIEVVTQQAKAPFRRTVSPNIFKKIIDLGRCGISYPVTVLDEQITYMSSDGNTARIRQYILGHHGSPLLQNAVKNPFGWQHREMIREFYRVKMTFGDGTEEIATREIDLRKSFG